MYRVIIQAGDKWDLTQTFLTLMNVEGSAFSTRLAAGLMSIQELRGGVT